MQLKHTYCKPSAVSISLVSAHALKRGSAQVVSPWLVAPCTRAPDGSAFAQTLSPAVVATVVLGRQASAFGSGSGFKKQFRCNCLVFQKQMNMRYVNLKEIERKLILKNNLQPIETHVLQKTWITCSIQTHLGGFLFFRPSSQVGSE